MSEQAAVPAHVPPELVRDVDLYNLPGASEDIHLAWKRVQDENPDIFFTPRYGGYWVVTRAKYLGEIWGDHERFSSSGAAAIPRMEHAPPQIPLEIDPPNHRFFRMPINLALSPKAVQVASEQARTLAIELIENLKPKGGCEFVADFARHLPMTIFLGLVNLPSEDREWLIEKTELMIRGGSDEIRMGVLQEVFGYLGGWVQKRFAEPGEDLISRIIQLKVDGRPITQQEILSECALVLFGGLDTVAGTMAFVARYLADYPEQRHELAANPDLIPQAVEEMLRRHSIPTVGRKLTTEVVLGDVTMKEGDFVMMAACLHGLDEQAWQEPLKVDFCRHAQEHMAFGKGVHKCPGANLARSEIRIFLEEWLKRIPDFSVKPGEQAITTSGNVAGVLRLPLVWPVD